MFNVIERKEEFVLGKFEKIYKVKEKETNYNVLRLILVTLLNEKGEEGAKEVRDTLEFLESDDGIKLGFKTSVPRDGRIFDVLVYTSSKEAGRLGDRAHLPEFAVINLALRSRLGTLVIKKLYPIDWYLNRDELEMGKIEELVKDVAEVVMAIEAK